MGHRGQPGHPEVQKVNLDGIATVRAAGKAAGILATELATSIDVDAYLKNDPQRMGELV